MQRPRNSVIFSVFSGLGIGIVYEVFQLLYEFYVAPGAAARLLACSKELVSKHGQFFFGAEVVVAVEEFAYLLHVLGCHRGLPLVQRARGCFELGLGGHIASAERGVRKGLRNQGPTALGLLYIVLAGAARGEAFSP